MSLFKINRGDSSNLPTSFHDGWAYFCTDTGEFFIDHPNNENVIVRTKISANYAEKLRYEKNGEYIEINVEDLITNIINGDGVESLESPTYATAYADKTIAFGGKAGTNNTISLNNQITAGFKAYYVKAIDFTNKLIYLAADKANFGNKDIDTRVTIPTAAIGKSFSIADTSHHPYCGTISAINSSIITYTGDLGFTDLLQGGDDDEDIFFIPAMPEVGIADIIFGNYSVIFGRGNKGSGSDSIVAGRDNVLASNYSAVFGRENIAGYATLVAGRYNEATGIDSAVLGGNSKATGNQAVAVNGGNEASGRSAFAEGNGTKSKGFATHSEGMGTIATTEAQHVEGKYNIEDTEEKYLHIVGNGTNYNSVITRSNAHTIDKQGNAWFKGDISVGGSDQDNSYKLAKQYEVDNVNTNLNNRINGIGDRVNTINSKIDNNLNALGLKDLAIYEKVQLRQDIYSPGGTPSSVTVAIDTDTSKNIKFVKVTPVNDNDAIYLSFYGVDKNNPIPIKDGTVTFKLLMRTNQQVTPVIKVLNPNGIGGSYGGTANKVSVGNGWEQFVITVKDIPANGTSFTQIYIFPAGTTAKASTLSSDAYFDIASWAVFDDIIKANVYDMTISASSYDYKDRAIQDQLDAKASNDLSNVTSNALKNLGAAPMYTYGTEDIEAGSPSTSPTGTLHFVYE